jgi:hypothetical protein
MQGNFYMEFEQFRGLMDNAFGVREEKGWSEMIQLLYRR